MVYVGVGNAFWPQVPAHGATDQAALDAIAQYIVNNVDAIWTTYSILGTDQQTYSGSARISIAVSEPSTAPLLLGMLGPAIGFGFFSRRRKKTA